MHMTSLNTQELSICNELPIGNGLDAYRDEIRDEIRMMTSSGDTGGSGDSSAILQRIVASRTNDSSLYVVVRMIPSLQSLRAVFRLPSRTSSGTLFGDLARLSSSTSRLNSADTALLLERVVNGAPDHDIWSAAYALVRQATPAPTVGPGGPATPPTTSTGALHHTTERREFMSGVIRQEMSGNFYYDVPGLFEAIFHSVPGLQALANDVSEKVSATSPASFDQNDIADWVRQEVNGFIEHVSEMALDGLDTERLKSRPVVCMPDKPAPGSTAERKLDIGFATGAPLAEECEWPDVLVAGQLKPNDKRAEHADTCYDLCRYVREVFASQDTRRFVHGFTLCGLTMTVYVFDRGAAYAVPAFDVEIERLKFVTVMLGYLLMNETQLGLDPTVTRDGEHRYMSIGGEKFRLDELICRQKGIVCRGTTCWKASRGETKYVIKDSWQHEETGDEGALLMAATKAGVRHVAPCYRYETVQIDDMDDDLQKTRQGIDIQTGRRMRRPRRIDTGAVSTSSMTTASTLRKRVASTTPDERGSKRSKSSTQTEEQHTPLGNRRHNRIVMSKSGKQLHLARTRLGVLRGLIDAITGHQDLLLKAGLLHRDISIGNVLLAEDESEGFIIDLDHSMNIERVQASGAKGCTGTRVFMSISSLRKERPQCYMDDLESIFWLLFWICVHYSEPVDRKGRATKYGKWNFADLADLGNEKVGLVDNAYVFKRDISAQFTDYYRPLFPWIDELRTEVFPEGRGWKKEDMGLYDRMKRVLERAMEDPAVKAP